MRIEVGLVVFVTGGASGLGEATVRNLHSRGASIAIADIDIAGMQVLQAELHERIFCISCDVTKEDSVKEAV